MPDSTHHTDFQLQSVPVDAVLHQILRNQQRVYSILFLCFLIAGLNFLRFFQSHYIHILMHNLFHHIFYNNKEVAQYRYLYSLSQATFSNTILYTANVLPYLYKILLPCMLVFPSAKPALYLLFYCVVAPILQKYLLTVPAPRNTHI